MKSRIKLLLTVLLASLAINSLLFWFFEHGRNPEIRNFFDVVWWWMVTSSTVGYGDIVPHTTPGRFVAILTIVSGFYVYVTTIAIFAEYAHDYIERHKLGRVQFKSRNHIVLCEYTAVADEIIQSLPSCPGLSEREVVIIASLVPFNPYPQHHFVSGVTLNPSILKKANIVYADYIFIFANLRFADPDVKTLHIASRVRKVNSKAVVFVELADPNHELLKHAPKDLIVVSCKEIMESILKGEALNPMEWQKKQGGA